MATEASNVNGVYDSQFNQPAELAASTPSHAASSSQASNTQQNKADPQEIGWYFVEQYYTTLSKTPERIHLFYSKKSQLVTGIEAEKVVPAVGTKAISEKIKALDIQDCKVRVLNVDSQSSFDNIVVQVIGELSNKSQPHHKFVQTFVLATQPNGYFVLNDIFRYLNEEEDEIIEDQPTEQSAPAVESAAAVEEPVETKAAEETVDTEESAAAVDEKLEQVEEPVAADEEKVNGTEPEVAAPEETAEEVEESATEEPVTIPAAEQPQDPEPTPEAETPPKTAPEVPSEQPQVPAAKKTWASLVSTSKPAIPALPTTTTAASQPKSQRPAPATQTKSASQTSTAPAAAAAVAVPATAAPASTPAAQGDEWQTAEHSKKAKGPQAKPAAEGIVHAYIKNVSDKIDARELRRILENFGELKYYDVSRQRNCAFVEFADTAGYTAAVAANPHEVNGESIVVEERRPRPNAYGANNPNFARGGSNAGRGRGGIQGQARTNSQGGAFQKEGRGGFQQRGGKSGNVTPKGRGQSQPV